MYYFFYDDQDCADGDVRLVQGPSAKEGTVEVCFSNLWGLIENSLWSLNDAKVVCTQLGYGAEGAKPTFNCQIIEYMCIVNKDYMFM